MHSAGRQQAQRQQAARTAPTGSAHSADRQRAQRRQAARTAPTGSAHSADRQRAQRRQAAHIATAGSAQRPGPTRIGSAQANHTDNAHRQRPGSTPKLLTQAARVQAAHIGSVVSHRPRGQDTRAGLGLTDQIGQEGLRWAELHGRVKTHGPTPTIMTVGRFVNSWG